MMKVSISGPSMLGADYFNFEVSDFSDMVLDTDSGELTVVVPVQVADTPVGMRVRFSREASRKLWIQLGRMQEVLEKDVQGRPPSDARN